MLHGPDSSQISVWLQRVRSKTFVGNKVFYVLRRRLERDCCDGGNVASRLVEQKKDNPLVCC